MVYLLFIILLIIFILSFILNKKDITAPSFVFSFGFLFQSVWVLLFYKKWNLNLHFNTFLVIAIGVVEFFLVTMLIKWLMNRKKDEDVSYELKEIKTNKLFEYLYFAFTILMGGVYLYFVVKAVNGSFSSIKSILEAISAYDVFVQFSTDYDAVHIPFVISNLNLAVIYSGYWFMYVAINNFFFNKKISIIQVLIIISTLVTSMLSGSRTPAFMMIVAGGCYYFVLLFRKKKYKNLLSIKAIVIIGLIGVVALVSFAPIAKLFGRGDMSKSSLTYLSLYCGAEVKNLDSYLQEKDFRYKNQIFGSQTLYPLIQFANKKLHLKGTEVYKLDLPFRSVGDTNLGNVYTTFYAYVYDFGYIGVIVFTFIMAAICGYLFERIKKVKKTEYPKLTILIYGVLFGCLVFSFFSNKFYEEVLSAVFIKKIIVWLACTYVFCKLDLKKIFKKK